MRATIDHPLIKRRARRARRAARRAPTESPAAAAEAPDVAAQRVREAGGPIDHAAYVCVCGYAFAAEVSTSVTCPHCGAPQAW